MIIFRCILIKTLNQYKYSNHGNEQLDLCFAKASYIESNIGKETDYLHKDELCCGGGIIFNNKHIFNVAKF